MTLHVAGRVERGLRCPRGDAPDLAGVHSDVEGAGRVWHQRADALAGQVHPRVARRPTRVIEVQDLDALACQKADGQAPLPGPPRRAGEERARPHPLGLALVSPARPHRIREAGGVRHRHRGRSASVPTIAVGASEMRPLLRIPAAVSPRHQGRDLVGVVRPVLGHERLARARTEGNVLDVAVTKGVDAGVPSGRRVVARRRPAVAVHAQHFAPQARQVLRQRRLVIVAGGDVEEAIRPEAQPAAAVRAGPAHGVRGVLEGDVGHDIGARADRRVAGVHDQAHDTVGPGAREGGGHKQVDATVSRELGIDRDAMRPALALAEEIGRGDRGPVAAEQGVPRAVRPAHRQPAAFFREQQGAVRREGQVPRAVEAVEHDGPCQRGRVVSTGAVDAGDGSASTKDEHRGEGEERVTCHDSAFLCSRPGHLRPPGLSVGKVQSMLMIKHA